MPSTMITVPSYKLRTFPFIMIIMGVFRKSVMSTLVIETDGCVESVACTCITIIEDTMITTLGTSMCTTGIIPGVPFTPSLPDRQLDSAWSTTDPIEGIIIRFDTLITIRIDTTEGGRMPKSARSTDITKRDVKELPCTETTKE